MNFIQNKSKEEIVSLIKSRIESEFNKHKDLDWQELAARKIYSTLTNETYKVVCDKCASVATVRDEYLEFILNSPCGTEYKRDDIEICGGKRTLSINQAQSK